MSDAGGGVRAAVARVVAVPTAWPAAQRRRAQAVLGVSAVIALCSVPVAALVWFAFDDARVHLAVVLLGLPACLLIRRRVRAGRVDAAGWLLVGYFLVVPVLGAVAIGEITVAPFVAVLAVVVAGVVLPPREVVVAGLLSLVTLLGLPLVLPAQRAYPWHEVDTYLALVIGLSTAAATVGAVMAELGFRSTDRSRRRAEQLAADLMVANTTLEEHVRRRTEELAAALERERRLTDSLAELSVRDPLTGLYNRRQLEDELTRLGAYAERTGTPLSLAIIDLDDFKQVNDRFTHVVGDDVLRSAAEVLTADTRASDVLVRLGGEEFALLMPGTGTDDAVGVCERMRLDLAAHAWDLVGSGLRVTASFGVATVGEGLRPTDLLMAADTRLLAAKRLGKNRVETSVA